MSLVNAKDNLIISLIGKFYQMSVPKVCSMGAQGFCIFFKGALQDKNDLHNNTKMLFVFLTV